MGKTLRDDEPTPLSWPPPGEKWWWTAPRGTPDGAEIPTNATPVVASANPDESPICQGEASKSHSPAVTKQTPNGNYECPDKDCGAIWFP